MSEETKQVYKFQCEICEIIPLQRIYLCELGHLVCGSCKARDPQIKCGVEDCDPRLPLNRDTSLERKLASLNLTSGDESYLKILGANLLEKHMESKPCDQRPIVCNLKDYRKCEMKRVAFKNYAFHLRGEHDMNPFLKVGTASPAVIQSYAMDFRQGSSIKPRLMESDGKDFVLNYDTEPVNVSQNRWMIRFWVTAILPQEEAQKYEISLRFLNRSTVLERSSSLEWKLRAHSIHQPFWKIQDQNDVGEISSVALSNYSARFVIGGNPSGSRTVGVWAYGWSLECGIAKMEIQNGKAATSTTANTPSASMTSYE